MLQNEINPFFMQTLKESLMITLMIFQNCYSHQLLICRVFGCRVVDAGSSAMTAPFRLLVKAGPFCTRAASPTTTKACPPPLVSATSQCPSWIPELTKMAQLDQPGHILTTWSSIIFCIIRFKAELFLFSSTHFL